MTTIYARAPVRLDLAGGWTDVPPFCEREGGAVVNVAINRYAYATAKTANRGVILNVVSKLLDSGVNEVSIETARGFGYKLTATPHQAQGSSELPEG